MNLISQLKDTEEQLSEIQARIDTYFTKKDAELLALQTERKRVLEKLHVLQDQKDVETISAWKEINPVGKAWVERQPLDEYESTPITLYEVISPEIYLETYLRVEDGDYYINSAIHRITVGAVEKFLQNPTTQDAAAIKLEMVEVMKKAFLKE